MNNKIIIISLIVIILFLIIYINDKCNKENFQSNTNKYTTKELEDWFSELDNAEKRCKQIEQIADNEEILEQNKEEERTFHELEELDKKIEELKELLKYLNIEQSKRNNISEKCQLSTQHKLNENYGLINKLNDSGLASDTKVNLDLNVSKTLSDILKSDTHKSESTSTSPTEQCNNPNKDKEGYVNMDSESFKNRFKGKCVGCDINKIYDDHNT